MKTRNEHNFSIFSIECIPFLVLVLNRNRIRSLYRANRRPRESQNHTRCQVCVESTGRSKNRGEIVSIRFPATSTAQRHRVKSTQLRFCVRKHQTIIPAPSSTCHLSPIAPPAFLGPPRKAVTSPPRYCLASVRPTERGRERTKERDSINA